MSDFLTELKEIRDKSLEDKQDAFLQATLERFRFFLKCRMEAMEDGVKNEMRRLVAKNPTRTQFHVQRTIAETGEECKNERYCYMKHEPHTVMKPSGMCLFFHSSKEEQEAFFAELRAIYPWCTVTFRQLPDHERKDCRPDWLHVLRITWTLFTCDLPCAS